MVNVKKETTLEDVVNAVKDLEKSINDRNELDIIDNRLFQWVLIVFTAFLAIIGATQLASAIIVPIILAGYMVCLIVVAAFSYFIGFKELLEKRKRIELEILNKLEALKQEQISRT
jgi:hypothetical protein